ncbi:hypothetical protein, partial [Mesorhizobium sp.]|uniref:hypothetical protein n=1 Tax=Mesorhizobium sp. TaxID=1871066 RepID=UPI0025CFBA11
LLAEFPQDCQHMLRRVAAQHPVQIGVQLGFPLFGGIAVGEAVAAAALKVLEVVRVPAFGEAVGADVAHHSGSWSVTFTRGRLPAITASRRPG